MLRKIWLLLIVVSLTAAQTIAEERLLRDLSADRPDTTESPDTVDVGHVQLEMSFIEYTRGLGTKSRAYSIAPFNLRFGLTNDTDLGLVFEPYVDQEDESYQNEEGIGDTTIRFRKNLWGNGKGDSSLSVAPYITLPTSDQTGEIGSGVFIPYGYDLSDTRSLGVMFEINASDNPERKKHDLTLLHTTALWSNITSELSSFIEYAGTFELEGNNENYTGSANIGAQFLLNSNLAVDFAAQRSLFAEQAEVTFIFGMAARR